MRNKRLLLGGIAAVVVLVLIVGGFIAVLHVLDARPGTPGANAGSATRRSDGSVTVAADLPEPATPVGHAPQPATQPVDDPRADRSGPHLGVACALDHGGRLWTGYEDAPLACFDPSTHRSRTFAPVDNGDDDAITCLAVDTHGRVWAGHSINGISVFNGVDWRAYGLIDGPLGEHVNHISVEPRTGDVWIATNRGITRYSDLLKAWSYFTRGNGLPSDDIASIAFDSIGNCFVATSDSGVAIASPGKNFSTWTSVRQTADIRGLPSGAGLCSDWCNDICVTRDDTVFVGTISGLSYSKDHGHSWSFLRGQDWLNKAKHATHPPPLPADAAAGKGAMIEDVVTALAQDADGNLLVGHAKFGADRIATAHVTVIQKLDKVTENVHQIAVGPGKQEYFATALNGVVSVDGQSFIPELSAAVTQDSTFEQSAADAGLPPPAAPPDAATLDQLRKQLAAAPSPNPQAAFVGTDWITGGDCIGRYGWDHETLPFFESVGRAQSISTDVFGGPHRSQQAGNLFTYFASLDSHNPRTLYMMRKWLREQGEWNDGSFNGEAYPRYFEGPDLWADVNTVAAQSLISLYIINNDGEDPAQYLRDYAIELKVGGDPIEEMDVAPSLARSRVRRFRDGLYVSFVVGPGDWAIKENRNGSPCTKINGVFVDQVSPSVGSEVDEPAGMIMLGGADFRPKWDDHPDKTNAATIAACALWHAVMADRLRAAPVDVADRLLAYRALAAGSSNEHLKAAWRWTLPLWTAADRKTWRDGVAAGIQAWTAKHPKSDANQNQDSPNQ